jgi:sortase A
VSFSSTPEQLDYPSRKSIRKRAKFSGFTGFLSEIFLSVGAIFALFLFWHLLWNDFIQGDRQSQAAMSIAQTWQTSSLDSQEVDAKAPAPSPSTDNPPVTTSPPEGQPFALLYVPRFGKDFVRPIAEGVSPQKVLNSGSLGIGRYPQSNQLGEYGNFALAAHRTTWGAPFGDIGELRLGDRIYVEVTEGWHSYVFRNLEYVWATEVDVLNPFPRMTGEYLGSRVITLTSCHPKFSDAERIVAYGVYEGWFPRRSGPPAEIAQMLREGF